MDGVLLLSNGAAPLGGAHQSGANQDCEDRYGKTLTPLIDAHTIAPGIGKLFRSSDPPSFHPFCALVCTQSRQSDDQGETIHNGANEGLAMGLGFSYCTQQGRHFWCTMAMRGGGAVY